MEYAIEAISHAHARLAAHLKDSIRDLRGRSPMYAPDQKVSWKFVADDQPPRQNG
jgi:hypothetical protein